MSNPNRYKEVINGKVYESTLNILGTYVRPYASYAPELTNKEVYVPESKVTSVGAMGEEVTKVAPQEKSMEK